MAFRDTLAEYRRSGSYRLQDGKELMESPSYNAHGSDSSYRHLRAAMYISGYSVECAVKAYIIQYLGTQTLLAAVDKLNARRRSRGLEPVENIARSSAGHRLIYLLQLTDLPQLPGYDAQLWGRISRWSSSWRYESERVEREIAVEFLTDIEKAYQWVLSKISGA